MQIHSRRKSNTVRSVYGTYCSRPNTLHSDDESYTFGQKYRGAARLATKPYGNRDPSIVGTGLYQNQGPHQYKRLNPSWMRGVKFFFECGQDDVARQRLSRDEVTVAIERMKARHPKPLLTVDDMPKIDELMKQDNREKTGNESESVQRAQDAHSDDERIALLALEEGEAIEQCLALRGTL